MKTLTPNFSSMVGLLMVTSNSLLKVAGPSVNPQVVRPAGSSLQRIAGLDPVTFMFEQERATVKPAVLRIIPQENETRRRISKMIRKQSASLADKQAAATPVVSKDIDGIQLLPLLVAAIRELEVKLRKVEEQLKNTEGSD